LKAQAAYWPLPERVLGLHGGPSRCEMVKASDWNYCLVKWQGLEYDQVTWEYVPQMVVVYGASMP